VNELRAIGGWLERETRALRGYLGEPQLWGALLIGLLLWSLAYQATPPQVLYIGGNPQTHQRDFDTPYLDGFADSEPGDTAPTPWWQQRVPPYRWASGEATVRLPGLGGDQWAISVLASSGRPDGSAVTSRWRAGQNAPTALVIDALPRRYALMGQTNAGDLLLTLATPRFVAPNDPRDLGLVLYRIEATAVRGAGLQTPAPYQLALLTGILLIGYALARRLGLARGATLLLCVCVAGVFAGLLVAQRIVLAQYTPALIVLMGACYLLAVLVAPLVAAGARAAGFATTVGERGAVLATLVGAFGIRMAGMLHPYAIFSDLGFHVNNLDRFIRGEVFLYAGLPCELGGGQAPYPPGQYLVLAPLRPLLSADRQQRDWLVQGSNALFESTAAVLIWLLLRWAGLGRRAALLGAALYMLAPPLLRSFSVGEFANLFAQSLLLPLLLFLVLGTPQARRGPMTAIGVAVLAAILFSHTGLTISVLATLAAWLPLWWFSQQPRLRSWHLLAGGALALLLALALFYSNYTHLLIDRQVALAAATTNAQAQRCPPGLPLGDKLRATAQSAFGVDGMIPPLLLISGGLGALWLWRRGTARLDLALLACWAGTLLSLGTLLTSDEAVRWQPFLFPVLCLGSGPLFAAWLRRGRAGGLVVLALLGYLAWFGLDFWVRRIADYLH
jgi:uncharacterized membrane protein